MSEFLANGVARLSVFRFQFVIIFALMYDSLVT